MYTGALRTPVEAMCGQGAVVGWRCRSLDGGVCPDRRRAPLARALQARTIQLSDAGRHARHPGVRSGAHSTGRLRRPRDARRARRSNASRRNSQGPGRSIVEPSSRPTKRQPNIATAAVTGMGGFIGTEAARAAGLSVVSLAASWASSQSAPRRLPSPAWLVESRTLSHEQPSGGLLRHQDRRRAGAVPGALERVCPPSRRFRRLSGAGRSRRRAVRRRRQGLRGPVRLLPMPPTGWPSWRWTSTARAGGKDPRSRSAGRAGRHCRRSAAGKSRVLAPSRWMRAPTCCRIAGTSPATVLQRSWPVRWMPRG